MADENLALFPPDQYRMRQLSVFNWGTFEGIHDIPIAEEGYLIVGPSGSGKTTLLDGLSVLLIPPRDLDFNAAASQGGDRKRKVDRGLVSYVRGTWGEQTDSSTKIVAAQNLRRSTTMSALAVTYLTSTGRTVTLARVFWIKGASTDKRGFAQRQPGFGMQFIVATRAFDLRELQFFQDAEFDVRKLRAAFEDEPINFYSEYKPYAERFRQLLDIDSENALRLLHRTQSAKSMDDLNEFLREYMLDRPDTFDIADRLVDEFKQLNDAHAAVETAEKQIKVLQPARTMYQERETLLLRQNELSELQVGLRGFEERLRIELLEERIAQDETKLVGIQGNIDVETANLRNRNALLDSLKEEQYQTGGASIAAMESDLEEQRETLKRRQIRRAAIERACKELGESMPFSSEDFAQLQTEARRELADSEGKLVEWDQEKDDLIRQQAPLVDQARELELELASLRERETNIPRNYLLIRQRIAGALNLEEEDIPYIGELIQVLPAEARWRGTIERLLHATSLSILVDNRHFDRVARYINDTHLGALLRFNRCVPRSVPPRVLSADSVVRKLQIKEGRWLAWLKTELENQYGDFACVDSPTALATVDKGLTEKGLVKRSKVQHVKDDRTNISDPAYWYTGFSNKDKIAQLEARGAALGGEIQGIGEKIDELKNKAASLRGRRSPCQTIADVETYEDFTISTVMQAIDLLERKIHALKEGNPALQELGVRIEQAKAAVHACEETLRELTSSRTTVQTSIKNDQDAVEDARQSPALMVELTPFVHESLTARLKEVMDSAKLEKLTLSRLDKIKDAMRSAIGADQLAKRERIGQCETAILLAFQEFLSTWKDEAGDMMNSLDSAPDFMALLARLESDRLPEFKARFFDLLETQSHQNLAALNTHMSQARKDIKDRLESVNAILVREPFNLNSERPTFLKIDDKDRHLDTVAEFRRRLKEALSNALSDDAEGAQARFALVSSIVHDLASEEKAAWRNTVLDVRQHVEFTCPERDEHGVEIQTWRGGADKSGGQRQKLAATCLAAALRYQLGGYDLHFPSFAPVVMDEAFDKSDARFTQTIMNIFRQFGFQTIVATPLKSVMALEPYVGGACYVDIRNFKSSGVKLIEYSQETRRLMLPAYIRNMAGHEATLSEVGNSDVEDDSEAA